MARNTWATFTLCAVVACLSLEATGAVVNPTDDAAVRNSAPDDTLGITEEGTVLTWTDYMNGWRGRSYIKFPLGGMPPRSQVVSAELHLYQYDAGGFVPIVNIHHVDDDLWTESAITWNNQPVPAPTAASMIVSKDIGFGVGWVSFDLLAGGVWDYDSDLGDGCVSLLVKSTELGDERHNFHSSEEAVAGDYQPYLEITVPEPAGVSLLALGGWVLLRRRRRA